MAEIQLTISTRFLERAVFILIILILLILLISKYVSDDCSPANKTGEEDGDVLAPGESGVENDDTADADQEPLRPEIPKDEPKPQPEPEPEPEPEPSSSGVLKLSIGDVDWEIMDDGRAKANSISITVDNGLSEDILLFTTIYLSESGNSDLEVYNPVWDRKELPLVKAGAKKTVTIKPSKSWPPGVEDGDRVLIEAEFEDFQGEISKEVSETQTV